MRWSEYCFITLYTFLFASKTIYLLTCILVNLSLYKFVFHFFFIVLSKEVISLFIPFMLLSKRWKWEMILLWVLEKYSVKYVG